MRKPNPSLGPMMEGFSGMMKESQSPDAIVAGQYGWTVTVVYGKNDRLRLERARNVFAIVAGELGTNVFKEAFTFVPKDQRGQGHIGRLYRMLLDKGLVVVSDTSSHSRPMRRTWMKLAQSYRVYSLAREDETSDSRAGLTRVQPDVVFDSPQLDGVLVAVKADTDEQTDERIGLALDELPDGFYADIAYEFRRMRSR